MAIIQSQQASKFSGGFMFNELQAINSRPEPFQFYTAHELWTNEHTSEKMLEYHLNESLDVSSRKMSFIERSVKWIVCHFGVDDTTEIADFGCGPGLYTTRLAESGATVTGIDFSNNSIEYAKKAAISKGLSINYVLTNYLDFETKSRFDLIIMIMCDFCALSPEQRKRMLLKFQNYLKPGGSVLLDVYSFKAFQKKEETAAYEFNQLNNFWSPDDYYGFVNAVKYDEEKVTLDKYTIIERSKKRIVYNWLQYFSPATLRKEFEENGFSIKEIYSDVAGTRYHPESTEFAVVAQRIE
jgi:cyclopropane fatty-acyl-phospholipid synthase-like methyltransferase